MKKKILYVYAPGGPPFDYLFPKMVNRCSVYTCILLPPSDYNKSILYKYSNDIKDLSHLEPERALEEIHKLAKALKVDAVFTFSEYLLKSVSDLAYKLGLKGVGKNVELGRNKILMRENWEKAGIPQPKFCSITQRSDIVKIKQLQLPILIKLAYGAGSVGQQIIYNLDEIEISVEKLLNATELARSLGKHEICERYSFPQLIAEEIIQSDTQSWYDKSGYGDYLSVEGLVKDGKYFPLAMTGRLPTVTPFTELGNLAPCILSSLKKEYIVNEVTRAIDALQFENCATHTEIKLKANGQIAFLETAARMGGVAIAKELDEVFGIDYIDLFLSVILGEDCNIPKFENDGARCAAASVALIGCNTLGESWKSPRVFNPEQVDWHKLVAGKASVEIQFSQSIPIGSNFPIYDLASGVLNYAGQAFLKSNDPSSLITAAYDLLNGLEQFLPEHA